MPACAPGQSIRVIHRNTSETVTEIRCDAPTRSRRRDEPWASVVTRVVTGLALVGVGIGAAVLAIAAREDSVGLTLCITLSVVALAGGVWHLREQGG